MLYKATHTTKVTRTTLVVHEGFPIRRTWPTVVVRSPARPIAVSAPSHYLPATRFASDIYRPAVRATSWQDADTIWPEYGWVETTLNVDAYGRRLFLSIGGQAQVAFAEVVFENGEARVVDFGDRNVRSGRYHLMDFPDGRRVDHVRVVARAALGARPISRTCSTPAASASIAAGSCRLTSAAG